MAQTQPPIIKVHQVYKVTPSQTTTTTTTLPLTYFDLLWTRLPPVERLFFYQLPNPTISFFDSLLPNLKHSLELTLQHFFPLAGNITWPHHSPIPIITYVPGHDSVPLTVSESNEDFNHISSDFCEVSKRRRLVPSLTISDEKTSLLALQITLFPNSGFVIGITTHHAAADGNCSTLFLKAWAYTCSKIIENPSLSSLPSLLSLPENLRPFLDRSVIKDPNGGLTQSFADTWLNFNGPNNKSVKLWETNNSEAAQIVDTESVKRVFKLNPSHIEKLKNYGKSKTGTVKVSTFSVTVAYCLSCLVKTEETENEDVVLLFTVDCRSRLDPVIPPSYFGNCLLTRLVSVEKEKVMGKEGFVTVLKGISEVLIGLESGVPNDEDKLMKKVESAVLEGKRIYSIAGSVRFGVYRIDFGYGRPKNVDVASVDKTGAFALSESRDGDGGVEIALTLKKRQMEAFSSLFYHQIQSFPIGQRLEAQLARGNPHCPTCTYRIPTCEELSQVVCRIIRWVNNLDLGQHQRRLHLRKGNSRHLWDSLSMSPNKPLHNSTQLVTASECLAGTPPTHSSEDSWKLRFGLVRKQVSGFLS
ncbi:hypothetical protein PIB30_026676 [Stylosanthes scabra]|uniref:Isoflavone-7-O-beta-glucoside 6''-O-malonyltransferase n=1 Tax=Stylosanthes scabra TaxID=79078 RepID=A0ABU6ZBU4_9FABA|nr:hypothetical protein [Stylosanthes scabra]